MVQKRALMAKIVAFVVQLFMAYTVRFMIARVLYFTVLVCVPMFVASPLWPQQLLPALGGASTHLTPAGPRME